MSSLPDEWSPPNVTGQASPPCSHFTLTKVGEKRAAMYGGYDGSNKLNHLFIVELGRHSVVSVKYWLFPYNDASFSTCSFQF